MSGVHRWSSREWRELRVLEFAEFDEVSREHWLRWIHEHYVAELVGNGVSQVDAEANASQSFSRLFPGGVPARGQMAGWAVRDATRIGELWIGPNGQDTRVWWVWWVQVFPEFRGQKLGRSLMELCESLARENGVTELGLQVMGGNTIARSLYHAMGYAESQIVMRKSIA